MAKRLSIRKAKKIASEGLSSAGNGFHSRRQERFIRARASGRPLTRMKHRSRRR